jgi:3-oxoacyl-[acyl-carrier-protein] synthase-3
MNLLFSGKYISGILTVVPDNVIQFEDEINNYNFSPQKSLKLKEIMGYKQKRVVANGETSSDLSIYGLNYLINSGLLKKSEIDAILFVSQTPDYVMPPTSNLIQARLGLGDNVYCLDINQGCAGYMVGLYQSFMLLDQDAIRTVVLINADVLSPRVSKRDRNSSPIIGDAAAITLVKKSAGNKIFATLNMAGQGGMALNIPAGGARLPCSSNTDIEESDSDGNFRSKNQLVMRGDEVFNFVQEKVPSMIKDLIKYSGVKLDEIFGFAFHQPNKFMLNKLADKIGISQSKMPSNIVENFGNSSGVTIPLNLCFNYKQQLLSHVEKYCLAGFGAGLSWASCIINIGKLTFCETIYYKDE